MVGHHQKITVPFNLPSQLNPTLVIKQTQHANSTFSRSKKHSRDYCTISSTVLNSVPELKTLFFSFQLRLFEPRFIYIEPFLSVRRRRIAGNRKEADLTIPRKPRIRMRSLPSCQEAKSTDWDSLRAFKSWPSDGFLFPIWWRSCFGADESLSRIGR